MYTNFIEDFLTKDECDVIINAHKSSTFSVLNFNGGVERNVKSIEYLPNLAEDIITKINSLNILNMVYSNIRYYIFNQYKLDNELPLHSDSSEVDRGGTITILVQLNENYEDGEFYYVIDDVEYMLPKKTGSIFIFDSNIEHGVKKIKSDIRYSLNCWPN
jgi:hypothetical protein